MSRRVLIGIGALAAAVVAAVVIVVIVSDDGSSNASSPATLVGPVWQWEALLGGDGSTVTPDDPSKYTIQFQDDNSVSVRADCNQGSGTYTEDRGVLTIDVSGITTARCEQGSLSDSYLRDLALVRAYVIEDAKLFLDLLADAGGLRHVQG